MKTFRSSKTLLLPSTRMGDRLAREAVWSTRKLKSKSKTEMPDKLSENSAGKSDSFGGFMPMRGVTGLLRRCGKPF